MYMSHLLEHLLSFLDAQPSLAPTQGGQANPRINQPFFYYVPQENLTAEMACI